MHGARRLLSRPLLTLALLGLVSPPGATSAADDSQAAVSLEPLGSFRVSYYWVAVEDARYSGLPRSEALRDTEDRVLARVSTAYRRAIELEGTGRLADGRVLNVAGRQQGEMRFREIAHRWGLGVDDRPLAPFVSVATDPERIPTGTLLFIGEFSGYLLPGGGIHHGHFRADDVGSAIRGNRLDIFIGSRDHLAEVESHVCPTGGSVTVYRARPSGE